MPPPPDRAQLERYVEEAASALGLPIDAEWRASVAEHYGRLLEAFDLIEQSGLYEP
jgi:hypothetical protein